MSDTCSIRFTGTVERINKASKSSFVTVESDTGGKFSSWSNLNLKDASHLSVGDRITVTASELPSGKVNQYTTRDGEEKVTAQITYWNPEVTVDHSEKAQAAPSSPPINDDDIPF